MPIKYDPRERRYLVEHNYLPPELGERIVNDARLLNRVLGYDMNSVEFAVRDGIPYAIDFMNAAPDMDINSITPHYFEWVVKAMADFAIEMAFQLTPHVIIMDVKMPRMSGIEATRRIKRFLPGVHVIGVSAFDDTFIEESMKAAGSSHFVTKDRANTLPDVISRMIAGSPVCPR